MRKTTIVICLLLTQLLCGCSTLLTRPSPLSISQVIDGRPPDHGLRVTEVFKDSPAEAAGIHPGDVITEYGDFKIVDDAGFWAAKNHYQSSIVSTVEIIVWRGKNRMSAKVPPGWLGINSVDHDDVSEAFWSFMNRFNGIRSIPEYMLDREFKGQFAEGPAAVAEKAKALIDQAERRGKLTPAQIQLYRIYLITDDASVEDQKRQAEMLDKFIASQPLGYIHMLGMDMFFKDKRYRAVIPCLKAYLKESSDDVSVRLNLGVAYNHVGMYEEAANAADYVFKHKLRVSDYGKSVAYLVKANSALGLKQYEKAVEFAQTSFALEPQPNRLAVELLAAAQSGDLRQFEQAVVRFQEAQPEKYFVLRLQIEAARAYALVKANQRREARKLVRMWTTDIDRAEGKVIDYWRDFPDGMEVGRNFATLRREGSDDNQRVPNQ